MIFTTTIEAKYNPNLEVFGVSGKVTSALGEPLIGATVSLKNGSIGTTTDLDGNYSLDVPNRNDTLEVSYTGFQVQGHCDLGL